MHEDDLEIEYSDNLVPNDAGSSMFEPVVDKERVKEEVKEKSAVLAAAPLLDEIISWFDSEIAKANSLEGLDLESRQPVAQQIQAKIIAGNFLRSAKQHLVDLKAQHVGEK